MLKTKGFRCVYPTYQGTLFNLTPENQQKLRIDRLQLVAGDFLKMRDVLAKLPAHLSPRAFLGLAGKTLTLTPITSTERRTRGCEDKNKVELDCFGFQRITNRDYLELARLLQPDSLESLSEEPEAQIKGLKALKRTIKKAKAFLEETLLDKKDHQRPWDIVAPLHGADSKELRKTALADAVEVKNRIGGVVVHELWRRVEEATGEAPEKGEKISRAEIIREILEHFDAEHTLVAGTGDFVQVLEAARAGARTFEVSHPFELARRGHALVLDTAEWQTRVQTMVRSTYRVKESDWNDPKKLDGLMNKTIDCSEPVFVHDMSPVQPNCVCYCCSHFSRAYLHHLLVHHEMTANVLLTLHNCHVSERFFDVLNSPAFAAHPDQFAVAFLNYFAQEKRSFELKERPRLQRMQPSQPEEQAEETKNEPEEEGREAQDGPGAAKKIRKAKGKPQKQNGHE